MIATLKIIGVFLILVVLILFVASYYFLSDMCTNSVVSSNSSPNDKWKVVLFERNCGATTGFSSQISLLKKNEKLQNIAGNVYIAESFPKDYSISWESTFLVKIIGARRSGKRENELNGIQFIYE